MLRDVDVFEAAYDANHRLVYGVALRMLRDAGRAEDLTAAVFLKLWNSPGSFAGGDLDAALCRVTRTMAMDVLHPGTQPAGEQSAGRMVCDVGAAIEKPPDFADRIRSAIAQLPADQREALELGFFKCTSVRE